MGASAGQATQAAGAMPDLMSNANLAKLPETGFSAADMGGMGGSGFGAFNSVDMAGSAPSTQIADLSGGNIPTTPMGQQQADMLGKENSFDFKKLSQSLSAVQQNQPAKLSPVNTQASGAGTGAQVPMIYGAPQNMSGAMQAIQQSQIGTQPMGIMGAMQQRKGY